MRHVTRALAGLGLPLLSTLALLVHAAPAAAQLRASSGVATNTLTIGLWTLSSHQRATGGFSHCAISAPYSNGVDLIFSLDSGGSWRIGLAHQRWNLDAGQPLPLALATHDRPPVAVVATAVTPWMVLSQPLRDPGLVDHLRAATRMVISGGSALFDLELRDIREAFAVLEGCAAEGEMPGPAGDDAEAAARLFEAIAAHPGLEGLRRVTGRSGSGLPNWDLVWRVGRLWGGIRVVRGEWALPAPDIADLIISDEARGCAGQYRSGILPYDGVPGGMRFHADCAAPRGGYHSRYAIMPRTAGGYYLYAVSMLGREDALGDLLAFDELLAGAFRRIQP